MHQETVLISRLHEGNCPVDAVIYLSQKAFDNLMRNRMKLRKNLIEAALPLEAINKAATFDQIPGIGPHPGGLPF